MYVPYMTSQRRLNTQQKSDIYRWNPLQIWGHEHKWEKTLEYFSGYQLETVSDLVARVHQMLLAPSHDSRHTIKTKYSHRYVRPNSVFIYDLKSANWNWYIAYSREFIFLPHSNFKLPKLGGCIIIEVHTLCRAGIQIKCTIVSLCSVFHKVALTEIPKVL